MSRRSDPIGIVEAAYRLGSDDDWLRGVRTAVARDVDTRWGVMGVRFRLDRGRFETVTVQDDDCAEAFVSALHLTMDDDSWMRRAHALAAAATGSPPVCTTMSERFGRLYRTRPWATDVLAPAGIGDILSLLAGDPDGEGCAINIALRHETRLAAPARRRWQRIAAHLCAGNRVRAALASPADPFAGAEAILDGRGRCAHAEAPAASRTARDTLAASARAVDRARGPLRRADPDEALAVWRGLVAGRWSLLDHVDRDGKRFFVARKNAPAVDPIAALTVAERQVAAYAALGHANKLIAYELGIGESAVAMRLARAARKLGARSRVGLVRLVRERLFGRGGEPG